MVATGSAAVVTDIAAAAVAVKWAEVAPDLTMGLTN